MSEDALRKFRQFNAERNDWEGVCRVCRMHRRGSQAELKAPCPNCGATDGQPR